MNRLVAGLAVSIRGPIEGRLSCHPGSHGAEVGAGTEVYPLPTLIIPLSLR